MTTPVVVSLLIGAVIGGACMAFWAAERIQDEAARQFDRGFERGRWLNDLAAVRALEAPAASNLSSRKRVGVAADGLLWVPTPTSPPGRGR